MRKTLNQRGWGSSTREKETVTSKRTGKSPYVALEGAVFTKLPQIHALAVRNAEDFVGLNIKVRGAGDLIAVAKRFGPDGGPQVIFATGFDIIGLLLNLEGSLAANRWKEDRPWSPAK
jgi:hypothetical protein